jgi:hypothetical protein
LASDIQEAVEADSSRVFHGPRTYPTPGRNAFCNPGSPPDGRTSQLVSFKRLGWRRNTLWSPWESTLGQPFWAGPETLTIVDQDLDRFVAFIAEN